MSLLGDLSFGLRLIRKRIGFASLAVVTIGMGIGASVSMFSGGSV